MKKILFFITASFCFASEAQFAPQAGLPGNTAVHKDSSIIINWANNCALQRGWMDIADTTLGKVTFGDATKAAGKADGDVVSLGDGGEAVFFFENAIVNGAGYDFAVFENGFPDPMNASMAYLELARVAVSNDGINYFYFQSTCNTDSTQQIAGTGMYTDASKLDHLAGKYIENYGTPFDLNELALLSALDINNIHFIKLTDVVGTIAETNGTHDKYFHKINDPYPTPFATGGFDVDAVGVMHHKYPLGLHDADEQNRLALYPNPCTGFLSVYCETAIVSATLFNLQGSKIMTFDNRLKVYDLRALSSGNYMLALVCKNGERHHQIIVKQ